MSKHLQSIGREATVHQYYSDVEYVTQIAQFRGEVDVAGDQYDSGGGGVGPGETTKALTEFVVCSVFGDGIDMDQRYLTE